MEITIITALISAAAAIIVSVINGNAQHKKTLSENEAHTQRMVAEMDKHNAVQTYEIQELRKTVDKHNKVIERVFKLEKSDEVEKEQIKVINHRIDDLEAFHKK